MANTFFGKAKDYIAEHNDKPFFLYYAMHQPHVPRTPNPRFVGSTDMGPRGDVIAEADWCIGELIKTQEKEQLQENTLIIFPSDNGPVDNDGYEDQTVDRRGTHNPRGPLSAAKHSPQDDGPPVS